jgi:16S rRNA processing protein RimM
VGRVIEPERSDRRAVGADPAGRTDGCIELGRIVATHGVRGELRLSLHNPASKVIGASSVLLLSSADGDRHQRRVLSARRHKRCVLLRVDGIDTATDADALVGCAVLVPRAALPAPESGAVYHADLIGCAVETTEGEHLGTVRELIVTGSNDVCVVRDDDREVLIPLVADVVAELDAEAGRLVIRPVPGLLDP